MNETEAWNLPQKIFGQTTPRASYRIPHIYQEALKTLAQRESERLGVKVSLASLIINFVTRDDNFARMKRTELRQIVKQLKKENPRVNPHETPSTTNETATTEHADR